MKRKKTIIDDENDTEAESLLIIKKKKKVAFCPSILAMLQSNNNRKFKASTIFSLLDFLTFSEKLGLRLTSKACNKCIKTKLPFLSKENFITTMSRSLREEYAQSKKRQSLNQSINYFSSEKKYSKKKTLIKLINSKNYMNIKKQVSLSHMVLPKKLAQ